MIHVFGAVLVDVIACREHFTPGTSCIAPITVQVGGVGYNIFRALAPAPRRLITALGDGPFSQHVHRVLGADSPHVLARSLPGRDVGLYAAFMERGRLLHGATDAATFEAAMDGPWLDEALAGVGAGDLVVADANLLAGPLAHLARGLGERGAWLCFEPVSVDKSERAREAVQDVFLATPTEEELEALVGEAAPPPSVIGAWMQARRVEHLVLTLGRQGLEWFHAGRSLRLTPTRALEVADTTGAGDTLLGALLQGLHAWLAERPGRAPDPELRAAVAERMPTLLRQAMDAVERYLTVRAAS